MIKISKKLPLFYDRILIEEAGIKEYIYWDYIRLPHLLVIGGTGSGKTFSIKEILSRLGLKIPSAQATVCDFKSDPEDFSILSNCPRYFAFDNCTVGLNSFYDAFEKRRSGEDTSRTMQILLFEEWASYVNFLDKKDADAAKTKLATLLMLGRSYNFHILVSQQRADAQYFSTARDNFNIIIALGNLSKESAAMFGFDRDLMMPSHQGEGHMLFNGGELKAFKVPRITNTAKLEYYMIQAVTR